MEHIHPNVADALRVAPPSGRPPPSLDPLRNRLARLEGDLQQALVNGQPTGALRASIAAANTDLAAAQTAIDEEIARVEAATAGSLDAELDAAEAAWRSELADFIGTVPLAPAA